MNINSYIKTLNIKNDQFVIVGVSSGPDSMALLDMLNKIFKNKIVCVHINHNVRKQSEEEKDFLKKYCKENNIIFEYYKIKEYHENNFENEARTKRYNFYEEILKKYNSKYLFLAHHGDDLIETILMKITRGSNLEGYAGIKMYTKKKDYFIIRPLLKYTKEDILKYNKENNIKYYIDESNNNSKYTRNRFRKNILPLLKKEDKNIHIKFLNYSNQIQETYNYIERITLEKINKEYSNNIINKSIFNKEDKLIQKYIIYYLLRRIYNDETNIIKEKNITDILKLINSNKPNSYINLPKNKIAIKEYQYIYIKEKEKTENNYQYIFNNKIEIFDIIIEKVDNKETDGNDVCRLNSKDIKFPLYLRNKKDGDYIYLFGSNNKKKISDILIENKIPIEKRKNYPVLIDSNDNILWIPFLKKSKYNVKKNDLYDIILTSHKKGEEKNEKEKN